MGWKTRQEEETGKSIFKRIKSISSDIKIVLVIIIIILIVIFVYKLATYDWTGGISDKAEGFVSEVIIGEEGKVTTITEASLQRVFETSELSTADYIYNAIAASYAEDETTVRYYVAYEGTVKAGIDFSRIIIEIKEDEKEIYLKIPGCEIQDAIVDFGSMEYIFVDSKANSETVSQEAYRLCVADLEQRAADDRQLLQMAKENALDAVEALVVPWVEQIDAEYKIIIQ